MSYLGINESSFRALGIVVPQGKAMEFVLVLGCWTTSLVFLIAAWAMSKKVGELPANTLASFSELTTPGYFPAENLDKAKTFIILNSMSQAFFLLGFFFLLRVVLSPL